MLPAFQACRNVHTIPEQVVALDHASDIDPDPELDTLVGRDIHIPTVHPTLDI
jgi:hypothetical protein